jgi:GNAT superfamily N-acetyltransferase
VNRVATPADIDRLAGIFWDNLLVHPGYVSHGEIQMGVATGDGSPAPGGQEKWRRYIAAKIAGPLFRVLVHEQEGEIDGFIVLEVGEDGDAPFGVICDLLVLPGARGSGTGSALLADGFAWLRSRGVSAFYLESGIHNHHAHAFFQRHGFRTVSHVFRRDIDNDTGSPGNDTEMKQY